MSEADKETPTNADKALCDRCGRRCLAKGMYGNYSTVIMDMYTCYHCNHTWFTKPLQREDVIKQSYST